MPTVSKPIADDIIAGKYPDDPAVNRIVLYRTPEGGEAYGVIYAGEDPDKYSASPYIIDPQIYWEQP